MKNILSLILILSLTSCNQLSKEVKSSFSTIGIKLDSFNKIEEKKIEKLFNEINSKRIKKYDGENSAMIYYSTIKHNHIVDSLITQLKSIRGNESEKKKIVELFEYTRTDLKAKLNTIKEFKIGTKIDSFLKKSSNIEIMPNFAIVSEFQNGKLNATKSAELLLCELNKKTNESNLTQVDISAIKPIIQGIWLPRKYVQDIYETHSAFLSSKSIPVISEMQIDPDQIQNDTLYVASSLNNHEGYGFKIWFENKNGKIIIGNNIREWNSEKFNFEFRYRTTPDTILSIVKKDKSDKILESDDFLRIRNSNHITNYGGMEYEYLARKLILEGSYQVLDSTKTKLANVQFDAETGEITNFKYDKYSFLTDFNGPIYEGDHIFLKNKIKERAFERLVIIKKEDTIFLDKPIEHFDGEYYGEKLDYHKYYLIEN